MAMLKSSLAVAGCAGQKHLDAGLAIMPVFQVYKKPGKSAKVARRVLIN
jgi:hypothetical protein